MAWKTAPVEKRKVVARVTASGQLQATVTVQVGAQVSGRVQKLFASQIGLAPSVCMERCIC